jgi:hypothetical protein
MKILEFLPSLFMLWLVIKVIRKGWRVFLALLFASIISGCASSSNSFDKSPCACNFESLGSSSQGAGHA